MKVLIWPTTFGADLWSLTRYLDQREDVEVRIVMADPHVFDREGVAQLFPIKAPFTARKWYHQLVRQTDFRPDVTIMDNQIPLVRTSPKGLMLWHGFGWKGPNDENEWKWLHRSLKRTWGDIRVPNADFRWQCFGPWDFEHRTTVSAIAPENCRILGSASHDDLRHPLDRALLQPFYPFDVVKRKTVLIAPTWHYGEVFAHWGSDNQLFDELLDHIERREANAILRLHDSYRYDREYRAFVDDLARRHPNLLVKFKNQNPDNLLDLQVSDVLITNYSSIANLFYATLRPTVHVYPVRHADEEFQWRRYTVAGVRSKSVPGARYIWKLPPEEHGGLLSSEFGELIKMLDRSLDDPACCRERAQAFLDKHMLGADGSSCERIWDALLELVAMEPGEATGETTSAR